MKKEFLLLLAVLLWCNAATSRTQYTLNESWYFHKGDTETALSESTEGWEIVSIPHTWNALDCLDDEAGNYRGICWYKRSLTVTDKMLEGRIYIRFEGANQEVELFVGGKSVGTHKGGYTAFCFDVTDFVIPGGNLISVKVNNEHNPDIPPLSADFVFYGGIYRDIYVVTTDNIHISNTNYASSGVYVTTPQVSAESARIEVRTLLSNASDKRADVVLFHRLTAPDGTVAAEVKTKVRIAPNTENMPVESAMSIQNPELWSTLAPNLYVVSTTITDRKGNSLDKTANSIGLRWYEFSPEKGLLLNGKHVKLIGTNRHQDYLLLGNALDGQRHIRDIELLKAMGGNFLRVSHYPQDPLVLQTCDRLGIVTSVEIPVVNAVTMSDEFEHNCVEMAKEMVYQSFNSPSVLIWAYMNEVLLRIPYAKTDATYTAYLNYVRKIASNIEHTFKEIDPARYTMLPCHSNANIYDQAGLAAMPDILGWNIYQGWYSGTFEGFEKQLDDTHKRFPDKVLMISEYGADVDPRIHSFVPERFDFSCEYGALYHEHYLPEIMKRDFVACATVWNLCDFYAEPRGDAVPHTNNKGITTLNRVPKESYHYYQASLRSTPVLKIASRQWLYRAGVDIGNGTSPQRVKVYTNLPSVEFFLNGRSLGEKSVANCCAEFDVPFTDGKNVMECTAIAGETTVRDMAEVDFCLQPLVFDRSATHINDLNILLGSRRYFEDTTLGVVWMPEREYSAGGWGYVGGREGRVKTNRGSQPASNRNILSTDNDPMYQTQRVGLEAFRADVPDGKYAVWLYWAELAVNGDTVSPYSLGNDVRTESVGRREFNVAINGNNVLECFNVAREGGELRPVVKRFEVTVENGVGLTIGFESVESETILNAVRIIKIF